MKKMRIRTFALWLFIGVLFGACSGPTREPGLLIVRLNDDPDGLNPVTSRSVLALPIMAKIFNSLYDYDYNTLELTPVLADSMRVPILTIDADGDSIFTYQFKILDGALWEDSTLVSVDDILFTLKMQLLCEMYGSSAPVFSELLQDVLWEKTEAGELLLHMSPKKLSALEQVQTLPILPQAIYDSEEVSALISMDMLGNPRKLERAYRANELLQKLADDFNSTQYSRVMLSGSGPYKFAAWESGQYIRLERKENYWADSISVSRLHLAGFPRQIIYKIIPDDASAIQAMNNKSLDIAADVNPDLFFKLKTDDQWNSRFSFFTPPALQYFYVCPNQQNPALAELAVRRALASVFDVQAIIESFFFGSATPICGPVHPLKSFYNKDLSPNSFSPEKAIQLLTSAGWMDMNADGILDKIAPGGDTLSLKFGLMTGQRQLGQDIAAVLKQDALKAGIQINIEIVDNTQFVTRLKEGAFDLANLSGRFSPGYDDLFFMWHSSSRNGAGNNFMYYESPVADSLIVRIQHTVDKDIKEQLYRLFQQIIYDDQVVLFLCAPDERIVARKTISLETMALKPGYCEHLVKEKG
jgi:ABC-type transport system substrate-binding protein